MERKFTAIQLILNAHSKTFFADDPNFEFFEIDGDLTKEQIEFVKSELVYFDGEDSPEGEISEGEIDNFLRSYNFFEVAQGVLLNSVDENGVPTESGIKTLQYLFKSADYTGSFSLLDLGDTGLEDFLKEEGYKGSVDGDLNSIQEPLANFVNNIKVMILSGETSVTQGEATKTDANEVLMQLNLDPYFDIFDEVSLFEINTVKDQSALMRQKFYGDEFLYSFGVYPKENWDEEYGNRSYLNIVFPSEASQALFREAIAEYDAVSGLSFKYTDDIWEANTLMAEFIDEDNKIGFYGTATLPQSYEEYTLFGRGNFEEGRRKSFVKSNYLHELGHNLGFKHSFGDNEYAYDENTPILEPDYDNNLHTNMSYDEYSKDLAVDGLGKVDILAMRELYGENPDHNKYNTQYIIKDIEASTYRVIDDQGGENLIDLSETSYGAYIDLRAGLSRGVSIKNPDHIIRYGMMDDASADYVKATDHDDLIILGDDTHTLFTGEGEDRVVVQVPGEYIIGDFSKNDELELLFSSNEAKVVTVNTYKNGVEIKASSNEGDTKILIPTKNKNRVAKKLAESFEEDGLTVFSQKFSRDINEDFLSLEEIIESMQEYSDLAPDSDSKINAVPYSLDDKEKSR